MQVQVSDLETHKKTSRKTTLRKQEGAIFLFGFSMICHFLQYFLKRYKSMIWNFLQIPEHKCQNLGHQSCLSKEHPVCSGKDSQG